MIESRGIFTSVTGPPAVPAIYCTSVARRQRPRTPIVTRSSLEESQGRRTKRIGERITLARDRNLNNKYRGCVNHDVWPRHTSTRRRSIKDLIADPREIDRGGERRNIIAAYRRLSITARNRRFTPASGKRLDYTPISRIEFMRVS